ncbi:uncharacterized protein [Drosophila virilis]|uniref:uncharacterized protein n=1 Tax=Drosophila virilis TaxID=7244 RepID=UPI0038B2B857
MPQKWFHFCMIFACITNMSFAQKQILFTKVQCVLMSSQFIKVDCVQESNNSITIHLTTNNKDIANLWIVSDLNLYIFGVKNVMRLHGLRTEYCKAPTPGSRPNLQTMLYQGIKNAQKCPLRRNSSYLFAQIKFDANYLPSYLPEYNFTYVGNLFGDSVKSGELRMLGSFCFTYNDCTGTAKANV